MPCHAHSSFNVSLLVLIALSLVGGWWAISSSHAEDKAKPKERYFEMRTYICHEGRLDALNARFRNHTNKLFVKHGMELIGYWMPVDEKDVLVYILAYPSKEAADASWKAFRADPVWLAAKAETEKDAPIVKQVISKFMTPTDYSLIK